MKKHISVLLLLALTLSLLSACGGSKDPQAASTPTPAAVPTPKVTEDTGGLTDGDYTAQARGFDLTKQVSVTVTIRDGKIDAITVGEHGETAGMVAAVKDRLIPRILEAQSTAVDSVTGATATSGAVKAAVADCWQQAGGSEKTLSSAAGAYVMNAVGPVITGNYENYDVDVAVVGMGGSGTAAALSAAESGARVLAIDKAGKWGGSSAVTSGTAAVNAPSQVAAEIEEWTDPITKEKRTKAAGEELVNKETLYKEWTAYTTVDGVQHAKEEIIRMDLDRSGETLDWLMGYGFQFDAARGFAGGKWGIFAPYSGSKSLTESFFASAYGKYTEMGGEYLLETAGTELIMEGEQIVGVKAVKADGTLVTIRAKAVILATGGFGGSERMMEKYLGEAWRLYGMTQNTGDGLLMGTAVGAATYNADMPPMSHFVAPWQIITSFEGTDNDIPYAMVCTGEALAVDQTGARRINETNLATNAYTMGAKYYTIWSKEQIDTLRAHGFAASTSGRYLNQGGVPADTPLTNIDAVLEEGIRMGFIYKADSLEALVKAIGGKMDAGTLTAAVEDYQDAAEGTDPLGKKAELFARVGAPAPESEYYIAVTGAPYIYSTCGGLDVDVDLRVLDGNGEAIPGLYAVGTDAMGVLFTNTKGYANYGGIAQGWAFVSGRTAGEKAAQYAK